MKKRFLCNPVLFFSGLAITVITGAIIFFMPIMVKIKGTVAEYVLYYFVGSCLYFSAMILCWPIWSQRVEFGPKSIKLVKGFKVVSEHPYKHYRIYKGTYWNGMTRKFIVFSLTALSPNELAHINTKLMSDKLIKIRYFEKRYKQMKGFLPDRVIQKIDVLFSE